MLGFLLLVNSTVRTIHTPFALYTTRIGNGNGGIGCIWHFIGASKLFVFCLRSVLSPHRAVCQRPQGEIQDPRLLRHVLILLSGGTLGGSSSAGLLLVRLLFLGVARHVDVKVVLVLATIYAQLGVWRSTGLLYLISSSSSSLVKTL